MPPTALRLAQLSAHVTEALAEEACLSQAAFNGLLHGIVRPSREPEANPSPRAEHRNPCPAGSLGRLFLPLLVCRVWISFFFLPPGVPGNCALIINCQRVWNRFAGPVNKPLPLGFLPESGSPRNHPRYTPDRHDGGGNSCQLSTANQPALACDCDRSVDRKHLANDMPYRRGLCADARYANGSVRCVTRILTTMGFASNSATSETIIAQKMTRAPYPLVINECYSTS